MVESKESSVAKELESRLDHFFSNSEETLDFTKTEDNFQNAFLQQLKSLLLSIDWEISDNTMNPFIDLVSEMGQTCRDDKDLQVFLQILEALAKYIKLNKVKSHPRAMGILNSAFYALEKVTLDNNITKKEKKKILLDEVKNFKNLKKQIASWRLKKHLDRKGQSSKKPFSSTEKKPTVRPIIKEDPLSGERIRDLEKNALPSQEAFACALEEIKGLIREEFRALRVELTLWRETEGKDPS